MKKWFPILSALLVLSLFLSGCWVEPESSDLCDKEGVLLTAHFDPYKGASEQSIQASAMEGESLDLQWYKDGEPIPGATGETYFATEPGVYYCAGTICGLPAGVPGADADGCLNMSSDPAVVAPCGGPKRVDVSVIIYGGWDGIPVQAWVGGTEQETLYTAQDANGEAAVLWTFYPPAGEAWDVSVAPQLPAGLDAERWQYKLVKIAAPLNDTETQEPSSASVTIAQGTQYIVYYQLVDTGETPAE